MRRDLLRKPVEPFAEVVAEGGAPFTKDACYCKGIVLDYAFIRNAIQHNRVDLIPFLFVGKVAPEDVPVLARRVNDGVVKPPHFLLSPMFRDLNGLAIWMAYSTFFTPRRRRDQRPLRRALRPRGLRKLSAVSGQPKRGRWPRR